MTDAGIMSEAEQLACSAFRKTFGHAPVWLTSAPGRVNLIGEFTDFNGGFVLPMAIEQRTALAAAPNHLNEIVLRSEASDETVSFELGRPLAPDPKGRWTNYPKGVLAGFVGRGASLTGFNAVIASTVPIGAGLSSSAALEAATELLFERVCGSPLDPVERALLCQRAEHLYAQVPCGLMDQYISLMGRPGQVLLLDCLSNSPAWIPWDDPTVTVLVVNTGVKHELSSGEYASRREACYAAARAMRVSSLREAGLDLLKAHETDMSEISMRCARHVIGENHRTRQAAGCIRDRDWAGLGELLYDSHESLRWDYRVSCRELDLVVHLAQRIGLAGGVFGARMTGGGFGGCAILLMRTEAQAHVAQEIETAYRRATGLAPRVFASRPCGGARSVTL
jgi:galactokinase